MKKLLKRIERGLDNSWEIVMTFVFGAGFIVSASSAVASYNWMLKSGSLVSAIPCFLLLMASILFASFFLMVLATDMMLRMTGSR